MTSATTWPCVSAPRLDLPRARPDPGDDRAVDDDIGQGFIRAEMRPTKSCRRVRLSFSPLKLRRLLSLLVEGATTRTPAQILAGAAQ